ncbi:MAG TPA: SAM-dependent methyltransferase, partial [Jatrophihabitantaceae bacterium]|nr:SAM-dependent methyltransferase [Jatrophihabitantaceae bacterium]
MSPTAGRVVLAGAPLGRAEDASARLRAALADAPVIAAEDTRRLQRLCRDLDVTPGGRVVSFFEGNESARVPQLLEARRAGEDVLVVTDAGMLLAMDGLTLVLSRTAILDIFLELFVLAAFAALVVDRDRMRVRVA